MNSYEAGWQSRVSCPDGPAKSKLGIRGHGHIRCPNAEQNMALEVHHRSARPRQSELVVKGLGLG